MDDLPPETFERFPGWEDRGLRDVNWEVPSREWVTWGGEAVLDGQLINPNLPFQEVCRIECPNPRALSATLVIAGDPLGGQTVDIQIFQGVGRIDLRREFTAFVPTSLDINVAARIFRIRARVFAQSPPGTPIIVQAVVAPIYPWLDAPRQGKPKPPRPKI